mmetsp:Transcript_19156/g.31776  ORF Transcript_19156/g.31776 Transcript_19156/m.31776 type:complete len:200 (-) Transcript_19156:1622-2221(-)
MIIFMVAVLSTWTGMSAAEWNRETIHCESGESIGHCVSADNLLPWLIPGAIFLIIPASMVIGAAWITKDIDSAYVETSWMYMGLFVQVLMLFLSIPNLVIVGGHETEGKYIGNVLLIFSFSMVLYATIMIPKYLAVWHTGIPKAKERCSSSGIVVRVARVRQAFAARILPPGPLSWSLWLASECYPESRASRVCRCMAR